MGTELRLLDEYTQPSYAVGGPILDASGVVYDPYGSILDKIGSLSFQIPLKSIADMAVVPGKAIQAWDTDLGEMNTFLVTDRSIRPNGDAVSATMICPEVSQELQWAVVPGLVSQAGNNLTERLGAVLANVNTDWPSFSPPKPFLQWGVTNQITDLNGLGWTIRGKNVAGALGDLGKIHNAHWKRGPGRTIIFGRFGGDSGIVLHRYATNPAGTDPNSRAILDYELGEDAIGIVNDITGFGAGNGATAISLQPLWARTDFLGYDPAHPIRARFRQDAAKGGTVLEDYDFFLDDQASIFGSPGVTPAWRRRQAYMTAANITPAGTQPAYLEAAAVALYNVMLTSLKYHAQPTNTIHVVTEHHGDVRGLAGQTLTVDMREVDEAGNPTLTINQKYVILRAQPKQSGDGWLCDWTLSTTALWEETLDTQIVGNLEAIKYFTTYASVFPSESNIWLEKDLDASHPITITVRENKRAVRTVEALFTLTMKPVQSTAQAAVSGPHSHTSAIPALAVPIPALSVSIPALYVPIPALSISGISIPDHAHGDTVPSHGHTSSAGDHGHGAGVGSHSHHINAVPVFIDPKAAGVVKYGTVSGTSVVTDVLAGTYGSHTHGESAASGATGISVGAGGGFSVGSSAFGANTITSGAGGGSYGSTTPATATSTAATASTTPATATSTAATAGTISGGEHGHAIQYGIYEGPKPTGVQFLIDGHPVAPYAAQGDRLDFDGTSLLNGQGGHTLTITAATLGRVQVEGLIVRYVTTGLGASNL
jgi:hypothetical protein